MAAKEECERIIREYELLKASQSGMMTETDHEERNRAQDLEEKIKRIRTDAEAAREAEEQMIQILDPAALDAYNKRKAEEEVIVKAERERIVYEYELKKWRDKEKAKMEREELLRQIELERKVEESKERKEVEAFLRKQEQKEAAEKAHPAKAEGQLGARSDYASVNQRTRSPVGRSLEEAEFGLDSARQETEAGRLEELVRRRLELNYIRDPEEREAEEARFKRLEESFKVDWELNRERKWRSREREEKLDRILPESRAKAERETRERKAERERILAHEREKEAEDKRTENVRDGLTEEQKVELDEEQRQRKSQAQATEQEAERIVREAQAKGDAYDREYPSLTAEDLAKRADEERALEEAMRKRLAQFGFKGNQIEAMIDPEDPEQQKREAARRLTILSKPLLNLPMRRSTSNTSMSKPFTTTISPMNTTRNLTTSSY